MCLNTKGLDTEICRLIRSFIAPINVWYTKERSHEYHMISTWSYRNSHMTRNTNQTAVLHTYRPCISLPAMMHSKQVYHEAQDGLPNIRL